MTEKEFKIWIFYSSKTEPELLTFYADGLAYLKDQDIDMEIIDTGKDPEKAKKYNVKSTPTVLIEKDKEVEKRYEVVSYLDGILEKEELKRILTDSEMEE